ncbi:MAG TPA: type II toxin-antitoxin system VapC family toxin, partial [Acidisarcina sp.]
AMTWCYPDEQSAYAYRVLDALENKQAIVPSLWAVEIANALVVGERRHRLAAADIAHFLKLLSGLSIETDPETASRAMGDTRSLARAHNLSAYDATYLELAMRGAMPLATLDEQLKKAAKSVGVAALA